MEGAKLKIFFLISLAASGSHGQTTQGFERSMKSLLGGGKDVFYLTGRMKRVMDKVGGSLVNENSEGFGESVNTLLDITTNISTEMMSGHHGQSPPEIVKHVMDAIKAIGPLACLTSDTRKDELTEMLIMAGITGAIMGELFGKEASSNGRLMRDPFSELGGIAGVMGSAAGAFVPTDGKRFDEKMFKWVMPNTKTVVSMWNRKRDMNRPNWQTIPLAMKNADGAVHKILRDMGTFAEALVHKIIPASSTWSQRHVLPTGNPGSVVGVENEIESKFKSLISSSGLVGGLYTTLQPSIPKSPAGLTSTIQNALTAVKIFVQVQEEMRSKAGKPDRTLSRYTMKQLDSQAVNIGEVAGLMAQRLRRNFENKNIMHGMGTSIMGIHGGTIFPSFNRNNVKIKGRKLTKNQRGRLNYQKSLVTARARKTMEDCMSCLLPTLEELERQKKMMMPKLEILDWDAPFHTLAKESLSQKGLPKFIAGDLWNKDWNFQDEKLEILLPEGLKMSDFDNSFIPKILEEPEIVDFIQYANKAGKTTLIDFLKGQSGASNLPTGSLQVLPKRVLELMPKRNEISDDNILDVLRDGAMDMYCIAEFVKNISHDRLIKFLEVASNRYWEEGSFVASPRMAAMMSKELARRLDDPEFDKQFSSLRAQTMIRFSCLFGFRAYIVDKLKDNFQDLIPDIDQCIEASLEHFNIDDKSAMRLEEELMEIYSGGVTVADLKELHLLINFVPDSIFYKMDQNEALKIAEANVSLNIKPFLSQFEPVVEALAHVATSMYNKVNDTSLVKSLHIIACGLRHLPGSADVYVSSSAMDAIKLTCRSTLRAAREERSERVRRCMRNSRCKGMELGRRRPKGYRGGPKRGGEKMDKESGAKEAPDAEEMEPDDGEDILSRTPDKLFQELQDKDGRIMLKPDMKRRVVQKLLDGNMLPSIESWEKLGDAASALPADLLKKTAMTELNTFITRNPFVIEQMPGFSKGAIVSKFGSSARGLLDDMGRLKSLTRKIPNSMLGNLDFNQNETLREILSAVHWKKHQALRVLSNTRSLTVNDIRRMGKLAVGLTCHDVRKIRFSMILRIAQELDAHIGNEMPADLAECIAMKVYLHLRSKYKNDRRKMQKALTRKMPPAVATFFPMVNLGEMPNCGRFFKKISHQVDRLFPTIPAVLILRDLANMAFNCFALSPPMNDSQKFRPMGPPFMEGSGGGPFPTNDYKGGALPKPPNGASPKPPNGAPPETQYEKGHEGVGFTMPPSTRRSEPDDDFALVNPSVGNHSYTGRPEDYEKESDVYYEEQMRRFPDENLGMMGSLMCRLDGKGFKHASVDQFKKILHLMRHCVQKIGKKTLAQIHRKITEEYGKPETWDNDVLRILGPFAATLTRNQLQNIDADLFAANYRFLRPPPKRERFLVGDKTSKTLDVMDLFMMPPDAMEYHGQGPTAVDSEFDAFLREDFYHAAIKNILKDTPTAKDIRRLGPDALPFLDLNSFSASEIVKALGVLGMTEMKLPASKEDLLKEKIKKFMTDNGTKTLSDNLVMRLCKLAPIFTATEIQSLFQVSTLETLAALGKAKWATASQVNTIMDIYLGGRNFASLTGLEVVAMGNMHCSLDTFNVDEIPVEALKFALQDLGELRCFTQDHIDTYKARIKNALGSIDAATLKEMGVLAAGLSADELTEFGKSTSDDTVSPNAKDVNLIPASALRVIPSTRIISGFDVSQYARLGSVNGAIILQRRDIFDNVGNATKNAIFAAAFGLNAGVYAGFVHHYRNFDKEAMAELDKQIEEMMKNMNFAMGGMGGHGPGRPHKMRPSRVQISSTYGLMDLSKAKRPKPPPLAGGISASDMNGFFDKRFLKDRVIVQMINSAATGNMKVIEVLTGQTSINDFPDSDFGSFPPKLLQGMNKDMIQEMSAEKLAILLDSDMVSKDPWSLSKMMKKVTLEQFKEALGLLTQKMQNKTDGIWRPPIKTQEAVATRFFQYDHGSEVDALNAFLSCMCPFSAGLPARRIMDLPQDESFIKPVIECIDLSYQDLEMRHKRQLLNWVNKMWKRDAMKAERAAALRSFILDFPLFQLQQTFTIEDVIWYVSSESLLRLDTTHRRFSKFARFIVKSLLKSDKTKFSDANFMEALGRAKCEVRVKHVKKLLSSEALKSLLDYTMAHCKDHETELRESMEECTGDAVLRLKRCKIMVKEMGKTVSINSVSSFMKLNKPVKMKLQRTSIRDLEMMKDVVDVYLKDADFSQLGSENIREVAGAFGALKPKDIEKIPEDAILENMDVLKDNTKLTKKQKRQIFKKIQSAGFELTDSSSVKDLGELVTSVPPNEFKKLSVSGLKESLSELKKHSAFLSPAQKKAIVSKLNEGSVEDIVNADLGDLVTEIPLSDLSTLETVEMDKLKDKPWTRGQAASLVQKFRENMNESLSVDGIREMGHASVGVTCKDIMEILDDEAYDAAQALVEETERKLTLDMDECVLNKVNYAMKVLDGADYLSNSSNKELASTLQYIPEDVAMMMPVVELETVPPEACMSIMENIGNANLEMLPLGVGDVKRKQLANISLTCIMENRLLEAPLDEREAVVLGQLVCDLAVEEWEDFSTEAFTDILPVLRDCLHRLSSSHIDYTKKFITETFGSNSTEWGEDVLTNLGHLVTILDKQTIDGIDNDVFYESMDTIMPPEFPENTDASKEVDYDAFYDKTITVVMAQKEEDEELRRRKKREVSVPTYDEILLLGPGNVRWSADELKTISDDDFTNSLETLGSIKSWSPEQKTALLERLERSYGSSDTWTEKVIGDAKHLMKALPYTELSKLQIEDIETCSLLGEVSFTNEERDLIIQSYLSTTGKTLRTLTSSELAGFGALACGILPNNIVELPDEEVKAVIKDLGEIDCWTQTQLDILKQIGLIGKGTSVPSAPELNEMGTLAAGMTSGDLSALPIESVAFVKPEAILLMDPSRIKDGFATNQLYAAGPANIAALMRPRIFNEISPEQRNALRQAVYGEDAELEDIPEEGEAANNTDSAKPGEFDVYGDDEADEEKTKETTTVKSDKTTSSACTAISIYSLLFALFAVAFLQNK